MRSMKKLSKEKTFYAIETELLAKQAEFQSVERERAIAEERQLQCKKKDKKSENGMRLKKR